MQSLVGIQQKLLGIEIQVNNVIYLMGAGRSGTTALATFLGNSRNIFNAGELHQLNEHIIEGKSCSCGNHLSECGFWSKVLLKNNYSSHDVINNVFSRDCDIEKHGSIVKHLFNQYPKKDLENYIDCQEALFAALCEISGKSYIIDSSKYIGRALALRKLNRMNFRIIYVVRDVRGVIHSFGKNVQTSRSPFSAILYYSAVNMVGELVYRLLPKHMIMRVCYERFIEKPRCVLDEISSFLELNFSEVKDRISNNSDFSVGHIIGGNRLKTEGKIKFRQDLEWRKSYTKSKSAFYYILTLPLMLINRFKL
jgi:sulfotransferase family protein